MTLLLGSDPEAFVRNRVTKRLVSAHEILPGTKDEPHRVECGAIQVDGFAAEYNIDPAADVDTFLKNFHRVTTQLDEYLRKADPDLELVYEPVADFDAKWFTLQPLDPKILGCDPDFDENGVEKVPPEGMMDLPFRTAAGHVHIGFTKGQDPFDKAHFNRCKQIATEFKTVEGYFPVTDVEKRRTKFYGAPGSFRPKTYGVELRSPSNKWVATASGREKMFDVTMKKMGELVKKYEM